MDDISIVLQLKKGNQLAFTTLYKKYGLQAFSLSFKYLCNKELAEDAVQNLFMKIWMKREELDDVALAAENAKSWTRISPLTAFYLLF